MKEPSRDLYNGLWQARGRMHPSFAATFWGGALFAFGFAAVRFLMLAEA